MKPSGHDRLMIAQKVLLSSLLASEKSYWEHIEAINVEWFMCKELRDIIPVMQKYAAKGIVCDPCHLSVECPEHMMYISECCETSSYGNPAPTIEWIKDFYIKRGIVSKAQEIIAHQDDCSVGELQSLGDCISTVSTGKNMSVSMSVVMSEAFASIEEGAKSNGIVGMQSGFGTLDEYTRGAQAGRMTVIGGRPSMGKTTIALNMVTEYAKQGHAGDIYSYETPVNLLGIRMLAAEAEVDNNALMSGKLHPQAQAKVQYAASVIAELPINMLYEPTMSIDDLCLSAREAHKTRGIKWIMVDYMQLIPVSELMSKQIREQQVAYISRKLKSLGKLGIHIISVSQLSRVEKGVERKPMLSDLRESGSIEQDADIVIFPYRKAYQNLDGGPISDEAEIILAKNKDGQTGVIPCRAYMNMFKFTS